MHNVWKKGFLLLLLLLFNVINSDRGLPLFREGLSLAITVFRQMSNTLIAVSRKIVQSMAPIASPYQSDDLMMESNLEKSTC